MRLTVGVRRAGLTRALSSRPAVPSPPLVQSLVAQAGERSGLGRGQAGADASGSLSCIAICSAQVGVGTPSSSTRCCFMVE